MKIYLKDDTDNLTFEGMTISANAGNRHYVQALAEAYAGEAEILSYIESEEAVDYLDYLTSTDWYVTRLAETGVEIPAEVLAKRAEARLEL
tara:strand:- start:55 stop:327 length:273 start_codon:yes stop_codon:yes gene_type:complete